MVVAPRSSVCLLGLLAALCARVANGSQPECNTGDPVRCEDDSLQICQGNQCCKDGALCPSADDDFVGCPYKKHYDCTIEGPTPAPGPPTPMSRPTTAPTPISCEEGDLVKCLDGSSCQFNQCCKDGSLCPSAENDFVGCPKPKGYDCDHIPTPPPSPTPAPPPTPTPPPTQCKEGDLVTCLDGSLCKGDQCCKDGSLCPSAENGFTGCPKPKGYDCDHVITPAPPPTEPTPSPTPIHFPPAPPPPADSVVTVDMYRALKESHIDHFPIVNDNLGGLMGILKYLHTEIIVEIALDPIRRERKYGIDAVMHRQFKVKNPPGFETGPDPYKYFGPFMAYDSGKYEGTDLPSEVSTIGDFVGVQAQEGDPRLAWPQEHRPFWFSVGNWCPNKAFDDKGTVPEPNPECSKIDGQYLMGGLCQGGDGASTMEPAVLPTGTRGCVYSYGRSVHVKLDVLAGITEEDCGGRLCTDWLDFREHCTNTSYKRAFDPDGNIKTSRKCIEYDIHPKCLHDCKAKKCKALSPSATELGLPFWEGRCNQAKNMQRRKKLEQILHGMTSEALLQV